MLFHYLEKCKAKLRAWFLHYAYSAHARLWLALFSFTEASFFPIAPDLFLVALLLVHPLRWFQYALITTVSSAFGGAFGYFIGAVFFDTVGASIISFYHLEPEVIYVGRLFEAHAFFATFTAAFTPLPYKVFTLAGGFFKVNFLDFLIASILGRGLRFFMIAYLMKFYGTTLKKLIIRYFNFISLVIIAIIALLFFL